MQVHCSLVNKITRSCLPHITFTCNLLSTTKVSSCPYFTLLFWGEIMLQELYTNALHMLNHMFKCLYILLICATTFNKTTFILDKFNSIMIVCMTITYQLYCIQIDYTVCVSMLPSYTLTQYSTWQSVSSKLYQSIMRDRHIFYLLIACYTFT